MKIIMKRPISWIGPYQIARKIVFWNKDLADKLGDILSYGKVMNGQFGDDEVVTAHGLRGHVRNSMTGEPKGFRM